MKSKVFAVLAGLLTYSAVHALPVYNPMQPDLLKYGVWTCGNECWGIELGYRGDFVFDRKMELRHEDSITFAAFPTITTINTTGAPTPLPAVGPLAFFGPEFLNPATITAPGAFVTDRRLRKYATSINAGQLTLNLWDRVDIYGWVGGGTAEFEEDISFNDVVTVAATGVATTTSAIPSFTTSVVGKTDEHVTWGVGARAILWKCGRTAIGLSADYQRFNARLRQLWIDGMPVQAVGPVSTTFVTVPGTLSGVSALAPVGTVGLEPSNFRIKSHEWQVALGISHRICMFVPYAAVTWSRKNTRLHQSVPFVVTTTPVVVGAPIVTEAIDLGQRWRSREDFGVAVGCSIVDSDRMHLTVEGRFVSECALTIAADFKF